MQEMQWQKSNYTAHSSQFHFVAYESTNPHFKPYTEGKKVAFIYILQSYNVLKY